MKVAVINKRDLLIEPETDFEDQFLRDFDIGDVFHKCGTTPAQSLGIILKRKDE